MLGPRVALKTLPPLEDQVARLAEEQLVRVFAVSPDLVSAVADEAAEGAAKLSDRRRRCRCRR